MKGFQPPQSQNFKMNSSPVVEAVSPAAACPIADEFFLAPPWRGELLRRDVLEEHVRNQLIPRCELHHAVAPPKAGHSVELEQHILD